MLSTFANVDGICEGRAPAGRLRPKRLQSAERFPLATLRSPRERCSLTWPRFEIRQRKRRNLP